MAMFGREVGRTALLMITSRLCKHQSFIDTDVCIYLYVYVTCTYACTYRLYRYRCRYNLTQSTIT